MEDDKLIANRIRELRKRQGLDVDAFGSMVGRSGKTVSAWETGRNTPSAAMLASICRAFGVDIDSFFPDDVTRIEYGAASLRLDENELLAIYRSLGERGKEQLLVFARGCKTSYKL